MHDVLIIGSGLGGLECGALLAKRGMKVLVLERSNPARSSLSVPESDSVMVRNPVPVGLNTAPGFIVSICAFVFCLGALNASGFSPFIYFRF